MSIRFGLAAYKGLPRYLLLETKRMLRRGQSPDLILNKCPGIYTVVPCVFSFVLLINLYFLIIYNISKDTEVSEKGAVNLLSIFHFFHISTGNTSPWQEPFLSVLTF